jgi:RimJ/RimL family protein N-acetyltransferase
MSWLPADFVHPKMVPIGEAGHHLRPIHPDDTELDMIAVMGSQERLWSIYGEAWGWPTTMTAEADRVDLDRHAQEIEDHESFNYALFDRDEAVLLGCVYIDPPEKPGADAEISWWVIDSLVGSELEAALDAFVPAWIGQDWPLEDQRYVGRDLSWREWIDLPDLPGI